MKHLLFSCSPGLDTVHSPRLRYSCSYGKGSWAELMTQSSCGCRTALCELERTAAAASSFLLSSGYLSLLYIQSLAEHSFSGFKLEEDF